MMSGHNTEQASFMGSTSVYGTVVPELYSLDSPFRSYNTLYTRLVAQKPLLTSDHFIHKTVNDHVKHMKSCINSFLCCSRKARNAKQHTRALCNIALACINGLQDETKTPKGHFPDRPCSKAARQTVLLALLQCFPSV